ncbi:hypothetical protein GL263_01565 [Streptomyces durbertensis]|uniref:Uncharacterized protein n=1 Tax=Streptomyces durbertensis TaxID=2448886 RepID=A0ABR6EA95_9ACTN|nr:hypothetical protein [Streptomyces durbertensis]MBB1242269.1 hypothetical protein [Streptomyces durbertensis]
MSRDLGATPDGQPGVLSGCLPVVFLIVLALLATGSSRFDVKRHDDFGDHGFLSARSAGGGVAMHAPEHTPWYGSFGAFELCVRKPATRVVLRDITYEADVEPLEVTPYIRTVRDEETVLSEDGSRSEETTQFFSRLGGPPAFDHDRTLAGTFSRKINGQVITRRCLDKPDQRKGYTELVFVMKFGAEGGHVPRAAINYTTHTGDYTLNLNWAMSGCGSAIPTPGSGLPEDACAAG